MKVAHIVWALKYGGIETMLVDIVNEQVKYCEVWVYVINELYDEALLKTINSKVKVVLCHRKPASQNLLPLIKLNLSLLRYRPHIIHCHQETLAQLILIPIIKVLTIHNTHSSPSQFKHYRRLFCISKAVKTYADNHGFPYGVVIYNGIHTNNILVKDKYRKKNESNIKLVCVGRLHPDKGQSVLIKALNNVVNIRIIPFITCDFIGDGDERESLETLTSRYGLTSNITFVGAKSRQWIYSHLKDYDLFVMPSISEGFGLTLAEACAAKVPVLTSDLEGPLEVIDGGKLGMVFFHGDDDELAKKISLFIDNGYKSTIVDEAYQFVLANYDVTKTARQYLEEYEKLLNRRR